MLVSFEPWRRIVGLAAPTPLTVRTTANKPVQIEMNRFRMIPPRNLSVIGHGGRAVSNKNPEAGPDGTVLRVTYAHRREWKSRICC